MAGILNGVKPGAAPMNAIGGSDKKASSKQPSKNAQYISSIRTKLASVSVVNEVNDDVRKLNTDKTRVLGYIVTTAPTVKFSVSSEKKMNGDEPVVLSEYKSEYDTWKAQKDAGAGPDGKKVGLAKTFWFDRTDKIVAKYVKPAGNPKAVILKVPDTLFAESDNTGVSDPAAVQTFVQNPSMKVIVLGYEDFLRRISQNTSGTVKEADFIAEAGSVEVKAVATTKNGVQTTKDIVRFQKATGSTRTSLLHPTNIIPLKAYKQAAKGSDGWGYALLKALYKNGKVMSTDFMPEAPQISKSGADNHDIADPNWAGSTLAEAVSFVGKNVSVNVTSTASVKFDGVKKDHPDEFKYSYEIEPLFAKEKTDKDGNLVPAKTGGDIFETWKKASGVSAEEGNMILEKCLGYMSSTSNKQSQTSITGAELYRAYMAPANFNIFGTKKAK